MRALVLRLLALCMLLTVVLPATASTIVLREARAHIQPEGHPAREVRIKLPFHWDVHHLALGSAVAGTATVRLNLPPASGTAEAMLAPRIGNSYVLRLNGITIAQEGNPRSNRVDLTKQPRMHLLPVLPPGTARTLEIELHAQAARSAGLGPVTVGPRAHIEALFASTYQWQVGGAVVVAVISSVLGVFAAFMWWRQREPAFLLYALGELLWAFQLSDVLFDHSPLPAPWWPIVIMSTRALAALCIVRFALIVLELDHGFLRRWWQALALGAVPILGLALMGVGRWMEIAYRVAIDLLVLWSCVQCMRVGWNSPSVEKRTIAYCFAAVAVAVGHDTLIMVVRPYVLPFLGLSQDWGMHYASISWARYAWVVFGLGMAWVISERMRRATAELEAANQELSRRVAEREAELEAIFAVAQQNARNEAAQRERQRLWRDLLDGLGARLSTAQRLASDETAERDTLVRTLRDAVDELKLTVDAMQDSDGDLAAILGAFRYRLAPRLKAANVELAWEVAPLPPVPGWSARHSRKLQMILFEAFSNLLAHSGADKACLSAQLNDDRSMLHITLSDNGRGFSVADTLPGGGHGLETMRSGAAQLAGQLQISSDGNGTRVELLLPLFQLHQGALQS